MYFKLFLTKNFFYLIFLISFEIRFLNTNNIFITYNFSSIFTSENPFNTFPPPFLSNLPHSALHHTSLGNHLNSSSNSIEGHHHLNLSHHHISQHPSQSSLTSNSSLSRYHQIEEISRSSSGEELITRGSLSSAARNLDREDMLEEQKLCAVCNDVAVCQHYGALTCEGCKGFFKV